MSEAMMSVSAPQQSGEDEAAVKRSTDCVYFLASPLTCKKGSECEYRHSEYARVNPRDCYFWLNSKCLNPKCTFRHPPLDGVAGTQAVASSGSSLSPSVPPSQPVTTPVINGPFTSKLGVSCIYFQKGFCSRGDKCAFSHGTSVTTLKGLHPHGPAATPSAGLPSQKKPFAGQKKCSQENKNSEENMSKSVGALANPKPSPFVAAAPSRNVVGTEKIVNGGKRITHPANGDNAHHGKTLSHISHVSNGNFAKRSSHISQNHVSDGHSSKYADDFLRESSPGFDVLVDNERGDHEYYNSEDQYKRPKGHEAMNSISLADYDNGYSADCRSLQDVDQDMVGNPYLLDSHVMQQRHAFREYMAPSDRSFVGSSDRDKRKYSRSKSPDRVYESDLRHRLSKKRRADCSKSLVNYDDIYDNRGGEQHYRSSSRRRSEYPMSHENSLSSRLRGRIKLPRRASPVKGSDMLPHRDADRGRNWSRSEAGGSQISSYHGKVHDRLKDKVQDKDSYMGRSLGNPINRTEEIMDGRNADFSGPRRLAELKGQGQRIKEDLRQSECDLSFEGPKPLSEILKKKRGAEAADSGNIVSSLGKDKISQKESTNCLEGGSKSTITKQSGLSSASKEDLSNQISNNMEDLRSLPSDYTGSAEETTGVSHTSLSLERSEVQTEDGMNVDEAAEDYEYNADGQEEGEYDYEYGDEGDYNYDEVENPEVDEEYVEDEDEDGDDFAKKIGVTL